jgi:hypothetical protein
MSNTPEKQNNSSPANSSSKINGADVDILFEDVKLEQSGFIGKKLKALLARFSFLRKKAVWIPLLVLFAFFVLGGGGFSYYEMTKTNRPGYVLSTLENSLISKDAASFSSIIDLPAFSDNFINDFINSIQKYHFVNSLLGEIPPTEIIVDNISFLFLNIFKGTEYENEFNNKTLFIPKHISDLLTQAKFEIKEQTGTDNYIISTKFYDDFWENIPLKLEVQHTNTGLKIVKLANLEEILQIYNMKLSKRHLQEQKYKSRKNKQDLYEMAIYLPNSSCSPHLAQSGDRKILYVNYTADPHYQKDHIVAFAVNITISNEDGIQILEDTIRSNTIVLPTSGVNMSTPFSLTENQVKLLTENGSLFCKATPTMLNTSSGSYFDTRKK